MLHDIAAFPAYAKKDVDHADRALELVGDILKDAGFPMEKLPAVQSAIRTHTEPRQLVERRVRPPRQAYPFARNQSTESRTAMSIGVCGRPSSRTALPAST